MQNDAQGLQQQFAALKAEAEQLVADLNDTQFNWHPDATQWSIAQCLDHLNALGNLYAQQFPEVIQAGERLSGEQNYRMGWLSRFFIRKMEPPVTTKFKAPPPFVPAPEKPLSSVVPAFLKLQELLIEQIRSADQVDWSRIKVVSPASKLLRFNLTAALAVIAAHERRHLWQAQQVRKNPNFPR